MDISKLLEKAEDAVRRRNYGFAINLYQQLLDLRPDDGDARRGLRRALAKKFEGKKASKVMAALSGALPLLSASICKVTRNHKGAARAYERYLSHDPTNKSINHRLAESLERAGAPASAVAVYEYLAEVHPDDGVAMKRAGALLYERKEMDRALAMYEMALGVDPRDQEAIRARKNLAAEGALVTSGIDRAGSSRELIKDSDAQREIEKGQRLHRTTDEVETELANVEKLLAGSPEDPKAMQRKGELLEMRGDRRAALAIFDQVLARYPDSFDLSVKAGDLRLALAKEEIDEARASGDEKRVKAAEESLRRDEVAEYRRRVAAHPTDPALRFLLGSALQRSDQVDDAIGEFQLSVKDPRRRVDSLVMLGQCFYKKGHLDLARSQLEKALEGLGGMNQRAKDILYNLGTISEKQGRKEDAAEFFKRIYEVDIGFRDVSRKIEQLKA